jgi:cytochrome P450
MTESTAVPGLPITADGFDIFTPLRRSGLDPIADLGRLRQHTPVRKLEFFLGISAWVVSGFPQVKDVLGDAARYSNDFAALTEASSGAAPADQHPGGLGMADPPQHTRLRKMLTPEFTMRRLRRLAPRIDEIIGELLDAMQASGSPVDLVESFAVPLPSLVICELLDVPYPDRAAFQSLSSARFDMFGGAGTGLDAISESLEFMHTLVTQQRREPGDGLLGMLIREYGDDLSDDELAGLADGILIGGHETTASMLALGTLTLLTHPEAADIARTGEPDAVHRLVEELLRYLTVVQVAFPRIARVDTEIGGEQIKAGDVVLCSLSGADRDTACTADADTFDPARQPSPHLAFGHGIHRCIGSELARMELRAAYPALFGRFPGLRLDRPVADIAFREYSVVYGVDALPVTW